MVMSLRLKPVLLYKSVPIKEHLKMGKNLVNNSKVQNSYMTVISAAIAKDSQATATDTNSLYSAVVVAPLRRPVAMYNPRITSMSTSIQVNAKMPLAMRACFPSPLLSIFRVLLTRYSYRNGKCVAFSISSKHILG